MAEETLEELVIKLSADVSGLSAGFEKAVKESKETAEKMESHLGKIKEGFEKVHGVIEKVALLIGVELGVHAFKELILGSMESITAIDKMSDKLGITTESLYGLKILAEDTGVSLEEITGGIQKMGLALAQAGSHAGPARSALVELGLSLKDLKDMRPDEAFGKMSDALNEMTDSQRKAHLSQVLFGRGGKELVNVIRAGSEGMEEAKKSAEELGFALTKVETTKVAKAKEQLDLVSSAIKVIGMRLAVETAPFIEVIAKRSTAAAKEVHGLTNSIKEFVENTIQGVAFIANTFQGFKILWAGLKVGFAGFSVGVWEGLGFIVKGVVYVVETTRNLVNALVQTFHSMTSGFEVIWSAMKIPVVMFVAFMGEQLAKMLENSAKVAGAFNVKMQESLQEAAFAVQRATGTMEASAKTDFENVAEAAVKQGQKTKEAWTGIFDMHGMGEKTDDIVKALGLDKANSMLERFKGDLREATDVPRPGDALVDWLHGVQDAAEKAAEEIAAVAPGGGGGDKKDSGMTKYQMELQDKLKALDLYNNEDLIKEQEQITAQQELLKAAKEQGLLTEAQYQVALQDLQLKHSERMNAIDSDGARKNLAIWESGYRGKAKIIGDVLGQVAGLMSSKNREMFEVGKAAAYASTVVNTASAAMGAYNAYASIQYVGPVLGAAAAAAAVAAGAAQLSTISSTSFGGGGSAGGSFSTVSPSGGGAPGGLSTGGGPQGGASGVGQGAAPSDITINVKGKDGMTKQELINLAEEIDKLKGDGVVVGKLKFV